MNSIKNKKNYILGILLLIVIITAVIMASLTGNTNKTKPFLFNTNAEYVNGIDVSSHNKLIDWKLASDNTDFAIIRAGYRGYGTEGTIVEDKYFKQNIKEANKEKLPAGVYFYTQAITEAEAEEEAEFVLSLIKNYNIDLPVFIDYEYPYDNAGNPIGRMYNAGLTKEASTAIINAFCKKIQNAGYYYGVYSSSNVFNFHLNARDFMQNTYIWVADYNKSVKFIGEYDIWQYSKNGSCPGVNSKFCDVNRWYVK